MTLLSLDASVWEKKLREASKIFLTTEKEKLDNFDWTGAGGRGTLF